ncbi:hypothetical protein MTR67_052518 [Solanum verrucosum]|uniref:Uncharacterized protein n=1 Tax=Solanum verrucosum TaxID=315347 RepID=A0AAF1A2Y2_SOLVR|nr:hypothetical protein MTR67_052518 [Solanum verrucosum]
MAAPGSSPITAPRASPSPSSENGSGPLENALSVTQTSQIDLKRLILERLFFSFMISFPLHLRFAFPKIQNWSPNRLYKEESRNPIIIHKSNKKSK